MGKNVKMSTQLVIGFISIGLLLVLSLYLGYTTAARIITVDNQEQYLHNYALLTAAGFILMIIIFCGVVFRVIRSIRISMSEVRRTLDALALGKVDIEIKKTQNDEFGVLLEDLQKVIDNLSYQAQIAQEAADGNLSVEVCLKSDEDVMGIALQKLFVNNKNTIGRIRESAHQVLVSSSQVAGASEALAEGSTEQASAIEQITASITDVAEKTRQNAEQANRAADLVATAIEDVKKGNAEMQEMVVAMQKINKASESISKIIKVIDDIAFQTNILALNAAVEAARAGEAGKGFAVVAEEVRNLAAKSAQAAAETAEMIEDSIIKVEAGSKIANDTAQALEEITKVVQQSEVIITDIAEASNYQATAIAQIDQAVEQVSQVVQTNSATSQECAAASVELANQVSLAEQMLAVYKLSDNNQQTRGNVANQRYENSYEKNEQIISLKSNLSKY